MYIAGMAPSERAQISVQEMKEREQAFRRMKIDLGTIVPHNKAEKLFFTHLLQTQSVILDWNHQQLWALEDFADRRHSKKYPLRVNDFLDRLDDDTNLPDLVLLLEINKIRVEVHNASGAFEKQDLELFLEDIQRAAAMANALFFPED